MKTIFTFLSIVCLIVSGVEVLHNNIIGAIFFLLWSFYFHYLSDKNN